MNEIKAVCMEKKRGRETEAIEKRNMTSSSANLNFWHRRPGFYMIGKLPASRVFRSFLFLSFFFSFSDNPLIPLSFIQSALSIFGWDDRNSPSGPTNCHVGRETQMLLLLVMVIVIVSI